MPKSTRAATNQGHYRTTPIGVLNTIPTDQLYYPTVITAMQSNMPHHHQTISQQQPLPPFATGGPVQQQPPVSQYQSMPVSVRSSSGAWSPTDDAALLNARAQGHTWAPIQAAYFPNKTPNACRKRHERLMEHRNSDDWDVLKLENLAKEYMGLRREIWTELAARTGEKWTVVEAKCMSSGLKNLQSAARSSARRDERFDPGNVNSGDSHGPYTDDSGIGLDDLEADYSPDGGVNYSPGTEGGRVQGGFENQAMLPHHQHQQMKRDQSHGHAHLLSIQGRPQYGMQQRVSSIDMGIGSIINRAPGH